MLPVGVARLRQGDVRYLASFAGPEGVIEVGAGGGWVAFLLKELCSVDILAYVYGIYVSLPAAHLTCHADSLHTACSGLVCQRFTTDMHMCMCVCVRVRGFVCVRACVCVCARVCAWFVRTGRCA